MVQWLGVSVITAGAWTQSLVGDLSRETQPKKKRKERKKEIRERICIFLIEVFAMYMYRCITESLGYTLETNTTLQICQ